MGWKAGVAVILMKVRTCLGFVKERNHHLLELPNHHPAFYPSASVGKGVCFGERWKGTVKFCFIPCRRISDHCSQLSCPEGRPTSAKLDS